MSGGIPKPGSAEEAEARRLVGAGPFSVSKPSQLSINGTDYDVVEVRDVRDRQFCVVFAVDCCGGDIAGAKARAGRIAEALNAREP